MSNLHPDLVLDNVEQLSDRDARRVMQTALRNLMDYADKGEFIDPETIAVFLNTAADGRLG